MSCKTEYNLCAVQGDTKTYELKFSKADGTPYDITDATVEMTIQLTPDSTIHKVATITSPETGVAEISLTEVDTDIPLGKYLYDVQISSTSIGVKTVLRGIFEVVWQITKD